MEITEAQKIALEKSDAAFIPPSEDLIARWNNAARTYLGTMSRTTQVGRYDSATGYFIYQDRVSLTKEEIEMMLEYRYKGYQTSSEKAYQYLWFMPAILPLHVAHNSSLKEGFAFCRKAVLITLYSYYPYCYTPSMEGTFNGCTALKYIVGTLRVERCLSMSNTFSGCSALEEVWLERLRCDVSFADSPNLRLDCLEYMMQNRINEETEPIAITLHPTTYAKIVDEGNAEWHALIALAESKNITLATV